MTEPFDSDAVLGMVRLGWCLAEVRGRNRPGAGLPGLPLNLPPRTNHELPLEIERTDAERRIEVQKVLSVLAQESTVDAGNPDPPSFTAQLDSAAKTLALAAAPGGSAHGAAKSPPAPASAPADGAAPSVPATSAPPSAPADGAAPSVTAPASAPADGAAPSAPPTSAPPSAPADGAAPSVPPTSAASAPADGAAPSVPPISAPVSAPADGAAPPAASVAGDWDALEEVIYQFDAQIQDALATRSLTVAAGYQLGRALAECYWALDPSQLPDKPVTWESWSFLLGEERCREIGRLLGRLSPYFHPYTAAAIAGSVQVWKNVAASADWLKEPDVYPKLYEQIRGWYELILLKQDPTTLIQPYQILRSYRLVWRTLRGFWFQLLVAALAAGAVGAFAWLLTKPSFSAGVKTLLATIGIAGISYAGLAVKVKNEAQAMLTRLKQDAYTDLITESITTAPLPPRSVQAPKGVLITPVTKRGKMMTIIQSRDITPVTPS
jgi:hypothetical protein